MKKVLLFTLLSFVAGLFTTTSSFATRIDRPVEEYVKMEMRKKKSEKKKSEKKWKKPEKRSKKSSRPNYLGPKPPKPDGRPVADSEATAALLGIGVMSLVAARRLAV